MNVALVVETSFPPVSRANLRLYRLGLALAGKGYEAYMVSPSFYPHSRVQGFGSDIHVVQHIGFGAFIYSSFIRLPVVFMHLIMSIIVLVGLHKREHLQVIHAWHPLAGLAAVLAGKLTGVRVFLDWTDFYSDIVRHESRLLTPVAQVIEHFILGNCDRIFTVSNEMKKALVGIGASSDRIFVIPDGVDPTMFNPEIDSSAIRRKYRLNDSATIIFHGDVKPIDGVDVLINAFALVLKRLPSAKLLIVGGGRKYFREVVQLAKKLGVDGSIIFTGWVPHRTVPGYIALADVGVMPLRSTLETNCYLSFKLFEYWAMGKPVVVSRVKAISKIVKDGVNGVLVEPGDVKDLAEALLCTLSDSGKAKLMGENGRRMVVGLYNWDSLMELEAKHYSEFLGRSIFGD
jgi:glycosyltransferase involved in cell wall biosynthesis